MGNGMVTADFAALATAAFPLDDSSRPLETLSIRYQNFQTPGSPISVTLSIERATPDPTSGVTSATFTYEILADGSGEIAFTLVGNVIPGTAIETLALDAQWLATGAGKATLAVVSGDGAGLTQTECWDATFAMTYNDKPWSTSEDSATPRCARVFRFFSKFDDLRGAGSEVRCCRTIRFHPLRKKDDLGRAFQANRSPLRTSARGRGDVRGEEADLPDP